jgi:DNA (cytosine-5)-methyltransferase 1
MAKPTLISLFSGGGGLDYGFEAAGFHTGACVEMDHDSCQTLIASRPKWNVIERSIFNVRTEEMLERAGARAGKIDLVIGGPPCQPFSKSGYWARGDSKRLDDPRARTLDAYLRVIAQAKPRAFLLENVQGLSFKNKGEGLQLLLAGIDAISESTGLKYRVSHQLLDAAAFGVPQHRARYFVIGASDGTEFRFPEPTHGTARPDLFTKLEPFHNTWDVLRDAPRDDEHDLTMRGNFAELLPTIPEGHNYLWHTARGVERAHEAGGKAGRDLFGWRRHYWTFLLKLAKARPSWTLQAQPGPSAGPFHWENRRLSPRELCRIQTIPDNVQVQGSLSSAQRQIGNAVPSLLGEVLGREIRRQLLGQRVVGAPKLMVKRSAKTPPPEVYETRVAKKYLHREGTDSAHPGTGRGRGAEARETQTSP